MFDLLNRRVYILSRHYNEVVRSFVLKYPHLAVHYDKNKEDSKSFEVI